MLLCQTMIHVDPRVPQPCIFIIYKRVPFVGEMNSWALGVILDTWTRNDVYDLRVLVSLLTRSSITLV